MGQASLDWESVRAECHALVAWGRFELLLASARREILEIKAQVRTLRLARAVAAFGRAASERAYNPDQPRVPAGNPDGGQWTSVLGGSSGELDEVQDSTTGDWIEVAANGHHFVPGAVATAKDLHLSDEAIRAFDREKTGPLLGRRHGWSPEHAVYNGAVRERLDQFIAERGIRPQDMTAAQAREFAASIRSSTDPRTRDFNLQIYRRQLFYLIRRYRIRDLAMKSDAQREREVREFDRLYEKIRGALAGFGDDDATLGRGSYWVHEDYWGVRQIKVYVPDRSLTAEVVEALRRTLHDMPDWEIVVACCPDDINTPRADMGLYVRDNVVLDGLIRALLPSPLKAIAFHLGRPITIDDQPLDWGDLPPTPNPFGVSS